MSMLIDMNWLVRTPSLTSHQIDMLRTSAHSLNSDPQNFELFNHENMLNDDNTETKQRRMSLALITHVLIWKVHFRSAATLRKKEHLSKSTMTTFTHFFLRLISYSLHSNISFCFGWREAKQDVNHKWSGTAIPVQTMIKLDTCLQSGCLSPWAWIIFLHKLSLLAYK